MYIASSPAPFPAFQCCLLTLKSWEWAWGRGYMYTSHSNAKTGSDVISDKSLVLFSCKTTITGGKSIGNHCFISTGPGGSMAVGSYMCPPPSGHLSYPRQQGHPVPHQAQPQLHFDPSMPHYWKRGMCICREGKTLLKHMT